MVKFNKTTFSETDLILASIFGYMLLKLIVDKLLELVVNFSNFKLHLLC